MKKILFVCTGNTCRSSMAEGLLRTALENDNSLKHKYEVTSAGISAHEGDFASNNSVRVLQNEWNINISSHRAKQLSKSLIEEAALILTMTRGHKQAILSHFPMTKPKVYTLKEFVSSNTVNTDIEAYNFAIDIMDPYGMSEQVYKRCAEEIKTAVFQLIDILRHQEIP